MNRAELVEAAARAIADVREKWKYRDEGDCPDDLLATAAFDAILAGLSEPSEEMIAAGIDAIKDNTLDRQSSSYEAVASWQAMLAVAARDAT